MKTVNFIEAVNSGKRFKKLNMTISWLELNKEKTAVFQCMDNGKEVAEVATELTNLINSKFILEEKSITITESELDEAIRYHVSGWFKESLVDAFKKELGF